MVALPDIGRTVLSLGEGNENCVEGCDLVAEIECRLDRDGPGLDRDRGIGDERLGTEGVSSEGRQYEEKQGRDRIGEYGYRATTRHSTDQLDLRQRRRGYNYYRAILTAGD